MPPKSNNGQASTTSDMDFADLSRWLPPEKSKELWLPIEKSCAELHPNWMRGDFEAMPKHSWFCMKRWVSDGKKNLSSLPVPISTCQVPSSSQDEGSSSKPGGSSRSKKENPPNSCKIVRLFKDKERPEVFQTLYKWFGDCRKTYNWALASIRENPDRYKVSDDKDLREHFVNDASIPPELSYLKNTPSHVRRSATQDLAQAFKTNFAKQRTNPNHHFEIKFRSKKENYSISIPRDGIRAILQEGNDRFLNMYPRFLKNVIRFQLRKNRYFPETIDSDCRLMVDKLRRIYLAVPFYAKPCENQAGLNRHEWCAIDPGIRTFATIYSPEPGVAYQVAKQDSQRLMRLCQHLDRLIGKRGLRKKSRALFRARQRIKNLVKEVHCQTINFLVKNFKNILIPSFDTQRMSSRANRKISRQSVRMMACWSHYAFRQRLLSKAAQYRTHVLVCSEHYTSKICTHCRSYNERLGAAKIFRCRNCGLQAERDAAASRNIYLKNFR